MEIFKNNNIYKCKWIFSIIWLYLLLYKYQETKERQVSQSFMGFGWKNQDKNTYLVSSLIIFSDKLRGGRPLILYFCPFLCQYTSL